MKKSFFRWALKSCSLILLFSLMAPAVFASERIFSDVGEGDDHFIAIKYLKEKKFIRGYDDASFKPEKEVNRAEALNMVQNAVPKKTLIKIKKAFDFADVKKNSWFYANVEEAFNNEIVAGYSDKLFHPEKQINRAEALKILLLQANESLPVTIEMPPYSDVQLDSWFAPYAAVSKELGLFMPSRDNDGQLNAQENLNRGQFAELLYHFLKSGSGTKFGRATFYADSLAGKGTSGGETYDAKVFTTAHRTLPFGTNLLVKNLANGKEIKVKVNDRGPYATGVELDLSKSAFAAIAATSTGIINVEYTILQTP